MTQNLPAGFRSDFLTCNGVRLHVVHNGPEFSGTTFDDDRPAILMLHGFPEFWIAWRDVMAALGDDFLIIAPDQRGYNLSDAPTGVENYQARLLVADMLDLMRQTVGDRKFALCGHDWGASIAYALAIQFPKLVSHLFIANGVHPACFQQGLIDDTAQAEASGYFHLLRQERAASVMAEDDFRRTFSMFEKFSSTPWLTEQIKQEYRDAWSGETRLAAMLNWYSSSPIMVPKPGETITDAPLYNVKPDKLRIAMPHRLVWGTGDQALLASSRQRLPEFCDDLSVVEVDNADHWILHTHGEQIAGEIRKLGG